METAVSYETITAEQRGAVTLITLNRPQALNALNSRVLEELIEAFAAFEADKGQRCAVLTGSGEKAFAAGADIKEMSDKPAADFYLEDFFARWTSHLVKAVRKPWIAAVNGFALGGGCELALCCDFVYASDKAKFGQPEVKLGVIPGFGGTQRLARRVGVAKAKELCMTGDVIDAAEALRIGLVNRVLPPEELLPQALATLHRIAAHAPLAIAKVKEVLHRGAELPLPQANDLEQQAFAELFASADQKEGMAAFLGKRKPVFTGG
jgi:enoyl-CoA hydratase